MNLITRFYWTAYLAGHLRGQAGFPFSALDAVKRAQDRRVRAMARHAYETVPYYRETMDRLGLAPGDLRTAADLARLPLIGPGELQGDPARFMSSAHPIGRCVRLETSGSTGQPRSVCCSANAIFQNAAHGERDRSVMTPLVGRKLGYRETVIGSALSSARKLQQFVRSHAAFPPGAPIVRQYLSVLDSPEENARLINEFRPDIIQSYGSYLGMLFSHLADTAAPFHRPKVVTYSSDALSDSVRRLITERFGIPVFSTYQAIEAFKIGFECEHHRGLHLNIDLYPVRIVDESGRDVPEGDTGELVISNLVNPAMVLLNYRLGDLVNALPGRCPCGRTLPMLAFPAGRCDDLVELPSGRMVNPVAVNKIFVREPLIRQYQIVQHSVARISASVVVDPAADRGELEQRVKARFSERLGDEVRLDVQFVDAVDRTASGKSRTLVSLVRGRSAAEPSGERSGAETDAEPAS
ncbi:MAG: AMP-binding protein [Planctomycetota bacterium]